MNDTVENRFAHNESYLLWVSHKTENGDMWYITSDEYRSKYQLWHGKKKTKWESVNPLDLYSHIKQ